MKNMAWAIENPSGYIYPYTVELTRREAVKCIMQIIGPEATWDEYRARHGYRAVKVRIMKVSE